MHISLNVSLVQCQGISAKVLFVKKYEPVESYFTKSCLYCLYKTQIAESKPKQDVPKMYTCCKMEYSGFFKV